MTWTPRRAAWLEDDLLLVTAGAVASPADADADAGSSRVVARAFVADDLMRAGEAAGAVLVAPFSPDRLGAGPVTLETAGTDRRLATEAADLGAVLTDLRTLLREELASWPAPARDRLIAFLATATAAHRPSQALSEALHAVREALRERLALSAEDLRVDRAVRVDGLHRVDDAVFYVHGRLSTPDGAVEGLRAVSPEGASADLLEQGAVVAAAGDAGSRSSPDARAQGASFACRFELPVASRLPDGWVVELRARGGRGAEAAATATTDPDAALRAVRACARPDAPRLEALLEDHVQPAVERLLERRRQAVAVARVDRHGDPPDAPDVSVVVPLGPQVELLEQQVVQFADDPDLRRCELLYVLGSPEEADVARTLAAGLFELYGLPLTVVNLTRDADAALATDAGASLATGRRLLLMHPDVLPVRPGWLGALVRFAEAAPSAVAVAPKLLHEDGTIEHAGLELRRDGAGWTVAGRFRGRAGTLAAADVARPVPAVSTACLLVGAANWADAGGLAGRHAGPAYADADLSLRLTASGRDLWYLPQVELVRVHERSSADADGGEVYDRWVFARRWGDRLAGDAASGRSAA